ncbi:MAG TPA: hypothetical protein VJZ76_25300 [Thermoanaerobaculia bacterium]|nr:hypothetical protein [Thermoanaerobaculia bacterium]
MTDQDLHDYDIIAFEGNSRATKGWESSLWFVTDTVHAAAGSFSGDTCDPNKQHQCVNASPSSPLKFKSGTVTKEKFAQCFNLDLANWPEKYLHASWVLIDVPAETGVDVDSKDFRLWVSGAQIGSNRTPDPDAFGVIRHQ